MQMQPTTSPSPSSPSSSTSSTFAAPPGVAAAAGASAAAAAAGSADGTPSWWESVSRQRSSILALASILPSCADLPVLADSDRPARALLSSPGAYSAVVRTLPSSGSGADPLCNWLYDALLSLDPDLRLAAVSFLPRLVAVYLSRLSDAPASVSLAGFEAVLLAAYTSELKLRAGKPVIVSVPDLSSPSLYHNPRHLNPRTHAPVSAAQAPVEAVVSPPLEPQLAIKSTKRAAIIGVAFDAYYSGIAFIPAISKVELCNIIAAWAGQYCPCRFELDAASEDNANLSPSMSSPSPSNARSAEDHGFRAAVTTHDLEIMGRLKIGEGGYCNVNGGTEDQPGGSRILLPWELLQPLLRILGHCLLAPLNLQEVQDAAAVAVRCVYARACHELSPQAILTARSLIQLNNLSRKAAAAGGSVGSTAPNSKPNTPGNQKQPEVLLVSN